MATANKYSKFAMGNAAGAIVFSFLFPFLGIIFSFIAIGLGIKGLSDYNKDNSIGGKAGAISAIVVGVLMIILFFVRIIIALTQMPASYYY